MREVLSRFKSKVVWGSIVSLGVVIFAAAGIDPTTLTTWPAVGHALVKIFSNPVLCVGCLGAIIGFINNPTNKTGL